MSIFSIIKNRRTIKQFSSKSVSDEKVKEWLQIATFAPNHKMTEPWKVLFIGEETRGKLKHKTNFGNAPILIAVLSHKGRNELEQKENYAAVSCFIQNLLLAAWEEGVGSFWSSVGASEAGRTTLEVEDDYEVVGVIAIGYPEVVPEAKERTSIEEKIVKLD